MAKMSEQEKEELFKLFMEFVSQVERGEKTVGQCRLFLRGKNPFPAPKPPMANRGPRRDEFQVLPDTFPWAFGDEGFPGR